MGNTVQEEVKVRGKNRKKKGHSVEGGVCRVKLLGVS